MVDHAVRLTDSGQKIAEATYARNRFFRTMPARRSMRSNPESSAALQRLLPDNKHEGEENQ